MRFDEIDIELKNKVENRLHEYFQMDEQCQYRIDENGYVSTSGTIQLKKKPPDGKLPIKFDHIGGNFRCHNRDLITLIGSPSFCISFSCYDNNLSTLIGSPKKISFDCYAIGNPLRSLDGLPTEIGREISLNWHEDLPLLKLLLIKGSPYIKLDDDPGHQIAPILNSYRGKGRGGVLQCAAELSKDGFKGNARM